MSSLVCFCTCFCSFFSCVAHMYTLNCRENTRYQSHQWNKGPQSETDDFLYQSRFFVSSVHKELVSGSLHNTVCFLSPQAKTRSLGWEIPCLTFQLLWTKISLTSKSQHRTCFHWYPYVSVSSLTKPNWHSLIFYSFLKGLDWSLMTRSSLKTNTKPCESKLHWDTTCLSSVTQSVKITLNQIRATLVIHTYYYHLDTLSCTQNSQAINQPSVTEPQNLTRSDFSCTKFVTNSNLRKNLLLLRAK